MRVAPGWRWAIVVAVGMACPGQADERPRTAEVKPATPLAADTALPGPTAGSAVGIPSAPSVALATIDAEPTRIPVIDVEPPRRPVPRATRPLRDLSLIVRPASPRRELTITIGGDLGFNSHMQAVRGDGGSKHGTHLSLRNLTRGLAPLLTGDLNFANLETIVTERNDLRAEPKAFNFRSHPAAVRHAIEIGFNVLSTANNHTMDFGVQGALDTLVHLDRMRSEGRLKAHAGLGRNREEASRPHLIDVRGAHVAFSAIGIVSSGFPYHRASADRPGQMAYQSDDDFDDTAQRLLETRADYRMLSVHQGTERQVQADDNAIRKLRHGAVSGYGIDLVIGHHAHVVQGIEFTEGRLIFYGLGNLLHPGMQNMASFGMCSDYGLLARIHLSSDEHGRLAARAVEVIPLTEMHIGTERMTGDRARDRIHVLNYLAAGLDDRGRRANGVRFQAQADGSGLACLPGAVREQGRIGQLCRSWEGVMATPGALRQRIAAACGPAAMTAVRAREIVARGMLRYDRRAESQSPVLAGN